MNLLAKERSKSRQRHKDVNAALLSASDPACDPKPNTFDYINYCESGGASGAELTAIHNRGCHRPTYQAEVTFSSSFLEKTYKHTWKKHTSNALFKATFYCCLGKFTHTLTHTRTRTRTDSDCIWATHSDIRFVLHFSRAGSFATDNMELSFLISIWTHSGIPFPPWTLINLYIVSYAA